MARIGKASPTTPTVKETVEDLKHSFTKTTDNIRKLLGNEKDKNNISLENKQKLRAEYGKAAQLARSLSQRVTDEKESAEWEDKFKKLSDRAASYGSVMRSIKATKTFDDVKGLDNVKNLVKSFMFLAENPEITKTYNLEGGLGMLMYGAPGTGKTMFAEAIANAMDLPLFIVTPADIFKSYVGESEQAVKQIFQEIDACQEGAILFVDECESIFSKRGQDTKDYKSAVTTELLQRINGFGVEGSKRIMIAATNRPDVIDPAYLRYKRFSHLIHVTPPDDVAKRAIISSKIRKLPVESDVTEDALMALADAETKKVIDSSLSGEKETVAHYSAADLCGIIEEACRIAIEEMQAKGITKPIPIRLDMFKKAFKKIPPSIPSALLEEYDNFRVNE